MQTTKNAQENKLNDVAVNNLNALIEFALNDLGDSFCVLSKDKKEIFIHVKKSKNI